MWCLKVKDFLHCTLIKIANRHILLTFETPTTCQHTASLEENISNQRMKSRNNNEQTKHTEEKFTAKALVA